MKQCQVISNTQIAAHSFVLEVTRDINFIAGQFVAIGLGNPAETRPYSIVSGEQDDTLKILYEVVPNGLLTPQMSRLTKGSCIEVSEAMGSFLPTTQKAVLIATGTGIAPFVSMISSGYANNKILLHGSRTLEGFYFHELFASRMGYNYLRYCTTEAAPGIISGRLTNHLKQMDDNDPDILYYLCGSNQMVIDVREILLNRQVPYENIKAEIYF